MKKFNNTEVSLISFAVLYYLQKVPAKHFKCFLFKDNTKRFNAVIKSMIKRKPNKDAREFINFAKWCKTELKKRANP